MVTDGASIVDVVILVVLANAMGVWWGAETPYNGALQLAPEDLKNFKRISSASTIAFGGAATFITGKLSPLLFSIAFCVGMSALYDWEYKKAKGVALDGE